MSKRLDKAPRFLKFRRFLCRVFGHFFRDVEILIFKIKTNELNNDMNATLTCHCCRRVFVHKDSPLAEDESLHHWT